MGVTHQRVNLINRNNFLKERDEDECRVILNRSIFYFGWCYNGIHLGQFRDCFDREVTIIEEK